MSKRTLKSKKATTKPAKAPAKANGNGKVVGRKVIRLVAIKNEKSGREALVRVTRDGRVTDARTAARVGAKKPFASWTEVEADSWAQATALYRAGKGTKASAGAK
jgi:hypothetical protein